MKNLGRVGTFLLLATGVMGLSAQAQDLTPPPVCAPDVSCGAVGTEAAGYNTSGNYVALTERIIVSIPARVGMHLHKTLWEVDLSDLNSDKSCKCYRAGEHNKLTGLDELYGGSLGGLRDLLAKGTWTGDAPMGSGVYQQVGTLNLDAKFARVKSYPGYEMNREGTQVIWKGPIVCIGQKVVEKFSNYPKGWTFTASTSSTTPSFPNLLVLDRFQAHTSGPGGLALGAWSTAGDYLIKGGANQSPVEMAKGSGVTGGWLDDHMLEVLVFDGSEVAGTYNTTVTFKLTGNL
jgi:hypothetical protein